MKKSIVLLAILTGVLFIACSDDNDDDDNYNGGAITEADLIGTWELTQVTVNGTIEPEECPTFRTFTADQVISQEYSGANCEEMETDTVNYTLEGSTLTITGSNFTQSVEIVSLSSTTLKITYEDNFEGENWVYVDTYTRQ